MSEPRKLTTEERDSLLGHYVGKGASPVTTLLAAMLEMTLRQRLSVYDALYDHYCRHCGIEQPSGDCQCNGPTR